MVQSSLLFSKAGDGSYVGGEGFVSVEENDRPIPPNFIPDGWQPPRGSEI